MTVIVGGLSVNYQMTGKGPVVVLLHGWGDRLETFEQLTGRLSKQYMVVALDLPGFGRSETPHKVFDLAAYAEVVADFLAKLDITHVYAFVGHSNGGAIAIRGLSSGILRAERLVLLASAGVRSTYQGRKKALRLAAKTLKLPTRLLPKSAQTRLKKRAYQAVGSDLFVAENLQETFKKVVSEDVVFESAMIAQPTLLIYGSLDRATPPEYGQRFAHQIEQSELKTIEGADHFLHQTHADEVGGLVSDFLGRA